MKGLYTSLSSQKYLDIVLQMNVLHKGYTTFCIDILKLNQNGPSLKGSRKCTYSNRVFSSNKTAYE